MEKIKREQIQRHIKTHTPRSDDDRNAVAMLSSFLRSGGKIAHNGFACNDTYPNIDGCFELVPNPDVSRRPKQNFSVQIKGTSIEKINTELESYSTTLAERPQIIVANKCDILPPDHDYSEFEKYVSDNFGTKPIYVSAATGKGLDCLIEEIRRELEDLPEITVYESEITEFEQSAFRANTTADTKVRRENDTYFVEGEWLLNLMGQINFDNYDSLNFFQRSLQKNGVIDLLKEKGVKDGDTVNIYDFEFEFLY